MKTASLRLLEVMVVRVNAGGMPPQGNIRKIITETTYKQMAGLNSRNFPEICPEISIPEINKGCRAFRSTSKRIRAAGL